MANEDHVDVERASNQMVVTITDEGGGFDFKKYFKLDESRLFDTHGRGVLLASSTLEIEYEPPGNRVRVRVPVQV